MTARFLYGANLHANGIRQHYLRHGGKGTPLVLVPGITSPAITWGFVSEALAEHFDVYTLDVRGRGLSDSHDGLDYGLDACADDLTGLIAGLGLGPCIVVGHSMGARIAIRAARRQPKDIARMVWVDPPVSGPGRRAYPANLAWYVDSIRLASKGADWKAMQAFLPSWTEAELRLRAEWLHTCSEQAIRVSYDGFHQDDIHADLSAIGAPALLMTAERGDVIRDDDVAELQRLKSGLQHVRVPNAGHMIPWDNFAGFMAAMNGYLAGA